MDVNSIVFDSPCLAAAAEAPYPALGLELAVLDRGSEGAGLGHAEHRLRLAVLGCGSGSAILSPSSTRCGPWAGPAECEAMSAIGNVSECHNEI